MIVWTLFGESVIVSCDQEGLLASILAMRQERLVATSSFTQITLVLFLPVKALASSAFQLSFGENKPTPLTSSWVLVCCQQERMQP
jgi:hypothetical protein